MTSSSLAVIGDKVPVTVLTGLLGSGKTTLLNHLLAEPQETGIAVVENEFGEVGIDDALVASELDRRPLGARCSRS